MPGRLRVFISSTMKDLANERDAVQNRLKSFNFDPVFAEEWRPHGTGIWERIAAEIDSCEVFLLIVGDKYGYIPPGWTISVTHREYREARRLGLPVLPFFRELKYESPRRTKDAKARDAFREEVSTWDANNVVQPFHLASDLADNAGAAVVGMLTDTFRHSISDRSSRARATRTAPPSAMTLSTVDLPEELVDSVRRREAVLFAGSGISLNAGLPSAAAFAQHLAAALHERTPDYAPLGAASAFANIAADLEAAAGRMFLVDKVRELLVPPLAIAPTVAHRKAVELFDTIITTNYDMLFERAAAERGTAPGILKLHGSIDDPASLVLTETDVADLDRHDDRTWNHVRLLIGTRPVIMLGTSLRDPSIIRLLQVTHLDRGGYFVVPDLVQATGARVGRWGLRPLLGSADAFMTSLHQRVMPAPVQGATSGAPRSARSSRGSTRRSSPTR